MRHTLKALALIAILPACYGMPALPDSHGTPYSLGAALSPQDVGQRGLGDCWFLAPLMALAYAQPHVIAEHIERAANGNILIGIYNRGGDGAWYSVDPNAPATIATTINPTGNVDWAHWFELAAESAGYNLAVGGAPGAGFQALTGLPADDYDMKCTSRDDLVGFLRDAHKYPTVLCTGPISDPHVAPSHCYAVTGWDGANATLSNPWGVDNVTATPSQILGWFNGLYAIQSAL